LRSLWQRLRKSDGWRETVALYAVHGATYFLPLLVIPFVARVLGPEQWGWLSMFQSFALYASMLIEYGFGLSGTRDVARQHEDAMGRARVLADVTAAKLILLAGLAGPIAGLWLVAPLFQEQGRLFAAALFFAVAQGASLVWYLQGVGQAARIAKAEVASRSVATGLVFVCLREPDQGWMLLFFNGMAATASVAIGWWQIRKDTPLLKPTWAGGVRALRMGLSMFFFRSAVSLYTLGNAFILGLFVAPQFVGFYAGAERIAKGFLGMLQPLSQSLFAQLNRRGNGPAEDTQRLGRLSMGLLTGVGALLGVVIWVAAPLLVRILLGPGFEASIPALRIFALLPWLVGMGTALGMNWMLPLGLDRQFNLIIAGAGILNVVLATLLAPGLQHMGMCIAVAAAEGLSWLVVSPICGTGAWTRLSVAVRKTPRPSRLSLPYEDQHCH
jgi:polysaccharide transporter, PST family